MLTEDTLCYVIIREYYDTWNGHQSTPLYVVLSKDKAEFDVKRLNKEAGEGFNHSFKEVELFVP